MAPQTLYDELRDAHVVHVEEDGTMLIYIECHLDHQVPSPQAFAGPRIAGPKVWPLEVNLATADHKLPSTDRSADIDGAAGARTRRVGTRENGGRGGCFTAMSEG
jgi:3-isopropylmalate/(R)-2-methylmalate dehydratase large subunit